MRRYFTSCHETNVPQIKLNVTQIHVLIIGCPVRLKTNGRIGIGIDSTSTVTLAATTDVGTERSQQIQNLDKEFAHLPLLFI
jgi:hypothetical protein